MTKTVAITFVEPAGGRTIATKIVPQGSMILDAALEAGIEVAATCGRRGRCEPVPANGRQGLWEWTP